MSDLDTLMVTFQTQLSDVMETVMKTAMYEVTRLVEDGLLQTVKRRNKEVESLKIQLQWAERKLSDKEGKDEEKTGKCVNCAKDDVEQFGDSAELRPKEQTDDICRDDGVKEEGDSVEIWTSSRQEVIPETAQTAESPTSTHSQESQATDEEDVLSAMDVKKEQLKKQACSSVLLVGWSGSLDSEVGAESQSATEMTEAQPKQTPENREDLVRGTIKQDPQICTAYILHEEEEESPMATDPCIEVDSGWGSLTVSTARLLDHSHASEKDSDPARTRSSLQQTDHELTESDNAPNSSSVGLLTRLDDSDALGVTIKQEVLEDSGVCVEMERKRKKMKKSGMASFSLKQYRLSSEQLKQNHISHRATAHEVLKLHSRVGAGLRLQAAIQQLHRPIRKPAHPLSNSTAAALSEAHSPIPNLNPLNRIPSTSKAAPPPHPPSVHRVHLGNKAATNRTSAPWVSIKTQLQSANSHHSNPLPHPDSHPHCGPKDHLRCGQCGRCFPHPSNLKAHLQTHTGERPFCCSLCGRSFTKLSNLKAHRRVHTGERPYCCLACGKCFTQKCNLKRHQRIHLDV